ncbi:MAG: nucleotidyltransferase family protein [Alcaligenes sp.]|nr:nucleotidyltransferase family protein [Alcaligenes sp.]HCA16501.1 mannose-1-phosphate guanylyltransferase [Alcaligenes faecalis]
MRAMILAAGRGERMRPLTDTCPKPLIPAGGQPLIVWHLRALAKAGIREVIINHAWLGEQIEATLGDGSQWGLQLSYSPEPSALETAGGIAKALDFFQGQPFLVMNGDVWSDWDPAQAFAMAERLQEGPELAWLVLTPNPPHHPAGDFGMQDGQLPLCAQTAAGARSATLSGIGVYKPELFAHLPKDQSAKLAPLLYAAIEHQHVLGTLHPGFWMDVGTPERLAQLNQHLESLAPSQ